MTVSAKPVTPKLMHMLHNSAQTKVVAVDAAEAAASVHLHVCSNGQHLCWHKLAYHRAAMWSEGAA